MKLLDLAQHLDGELIGDPDIDIKSITTLTTSNSDAIRIIMEAKYIPLAKNCDGSTFITFKHIPELTNQIVVSNPKKALAQTIALLYPTKPHSDVSISKHAVIHPSVILGKNVHISPFVVINKNCQIGDNTRIESNVTIHENSTIGSQSHIKSGTIINKLTHIGSHVMIGPNNSIGIEGFGFYREENTWHRIPHPYGVIIEDYVEIGANNCISRGCLEPTHIKSHCKIDTLNHIAHNCIIGHDTAIASGNIFGGSTKIGDHCLISGSVTISDHIIIEDHCTILGKSGVTKNIPANSVVSGYPAQPHKDELKLQAKLRKK